jgi:hypothetical protein
MFFTKTIIKEVKIEDKSRINELEEKIKSIKADFDSRERILKNELEIKINEATVEKDKENNQLKSDNAVLKSEVSILEKAFENMGFDVKDMKEILNKLVDGIISKNEIKVLK